MCKYQFIKAIIVLTLISCTSFAQIKASSKIGNPSILSPHAKPIIIHNGKVFVVNTAADTMDVIDTKTRKITSRVPVGIDPVSLALRPDGMEIWVSNHISDTVSVIDTNPQSDTFLKVIATIQDIDIKTKTTNFDEPVGIAFANNNKAYVALSSENLIAVIDVHSRKVTKKIYVNAQEPRAITVRNNKLYVIPFESNNKKHSCPVVTARHPSMGN